jgi:hypothetical protein
MQRTGGGGAAFAEESWTLPGDAVQQVMRDETCMALPLLKPIGKRLRAGAPKQFFISVKSLDTQEEYMHHKPFISLVGYQVYFVNSYVFKKDEAVIARSVFPELKEPSTNGVGPVSVSDFQLANGARYQMIVVNALDPEIGNICVYLKSPLLPVSLDGFNGMNLRLHQTKKCLDNFAVLGLLENAYRGVTQHTDEASTNAFARGGPATVADTEDDVLLALLTHGPSAVAPLGGRRCTLGGIAKMYDIERTAGSVSLPLVLRHLHWLQFAIDEDTSVPYRIIAPNKFAYAVHMPNVCGWEIFFSVNMAATDNELANLFMQTRQRLPLMPAVGPSQEAKKQLQLLQTRDLPLGTKTTERYLGYYLKKINEASEAQKGKLAAGMALEPDKWDTDSFFTRMQVVALGNVKAGLVRRTEVLDNFIQMEKAKPMLQYLSSFYERFGSRTQDEAEIAVPFSVEEVLTVVLQAFIGCATAVWEGMAAASRLGMESKERADAFVTLMKTTLKNTFVSIDYEMLPILLKVCMNRPNTNWWEVAQEHVWIQNLPKGLGLGSAQNVACICTTFLYHAKRLASYFPQSLFPEYATSDWKRLIQEACDAKSSLRDARDLYHDLQTADRNKFAGPAAAARPMSYCTALGFAMLEGIPDGAELQIKGM